MENVTERNNGYMPQRAKGMSCSDGRAEDGYAMLPAG